MISLGVIFLISCIMFMSIGANGNWNFIIPFRGKKLLMLIIIAYAVGVSTLIFQTLTENPILTPSILGFDSLYITLQTVLVFFLGSFGYSALNPNIKFILTLPLMMIASLILFSLLFKKSQNLHLIILIGIIFGILLNSINSFLQRMLDPMLFAVAQGSFFAQFNTIKNDLLIIGTIILSISSIFVWRLRNELDVLMLGSNFAINLGINYYKLRLKILILVAILIGVATTLVGPISFFGLLVCALVNYLTPSFYHRYRIIAVFLMSGIILILGQTIFERVLKMASVLGVVVEFLGGIIFLLLIFRKNR